MKTLFLSLLAGAVLAGCGATPCERYTAANDAFYSGKSECAYTDGAATITMTRGTAACSSLTACSAADLQALDTFAGCLEKAPRCAAGAEQQATSAGMACAFTLAGSLSPACGAALQ